jgi:hypothetical protein
MSLQTTLLGREVKLIDAGTGNVPAECVDMEAIIMTVYIDDIKKKPMYTVMVKSDQMGIKAFCCSLRDVTDADFQV